MVDICSKTIIGFEKDQLYVLPGYAAVFDFQVCRTARHLRSVGEAKPNPSHVYRTEVAGEVTRLTKRPTSLVSYANN